MTDRAEDIDLTTTKDEPLDLNDRAALEEIDLYGELIIVASASPGPLSWTDIDRALGVRAASARRAEGLAQPS